MIPPDDQEAMALVASPPTLETALVEYPELSNETEVLARAHEAVATTNDGRALTVLSMYVLSRRRGSGHALASMFALQRPPQPKTTDTFWAGRAPWYQVFGEEFAESRKRMLQQRGVQLSPGDEYMPELARFPGDPEAVVPFSGARDYIRALMEKRGQGCEGAVCVRRRTPESHPLEDRVPLAEDIIQSRMQEARRSSEEDRRLPDSELREKIIAEHGCTDKIVQNLVED